MTQYVFTLSSRMVAIASACLVLLGILLFLLGVEIGKLWLGNPASAQAPIPTSYSSSTDQVAQSTKASDADLFKNKAP